MSIEDLQQSTAAGHPLQMTDDDQTKFQRGAELLKHVQAGKLFDDYWVPIGEGLSAVRRTVVTALRLKKASGGYYKWAFSRVCVETPYADIHSVDRANLLFCMEHLADITEMRVGWTPSERASINHPTSMTKRLREFLRRPIGDQIGEEATPRRNASKMALLKDKNAELTRAKLDLEERLAAAEQHGGSRFDLSQDSADIIASVLTDPTVISAHKAKAIADGILARLKQMRRQTQPAG
jgi:hypothetical protein